MHCCSNLMHCCSINLANIIIEHMAQSISAQWSIPAPLVWRQRDKAAQSVSIAPGEERTHTAGTHSDNAQMTCSWHHQHWARGISTARPDTAEQVMHSWLPLLAPCAQGRGCETRMLLHPGWLASSSLPQVPCPPEAWGCSCCKDTFALCQVYSQGSAHCGSLGCISMWLLCCQPCTGSLQQKHPTHITKKMNLTHFAVL